jgi:hypothetical protein
MLNTLLLQALAVAVALRRFMTVAAVAALVDTELQLDLQSLLVQQLP